MVRGRQRSAAGNRITKETCPKYFEANNNASLAFLGRKAKCANGIAHIFQTVPQEAELATASLSLPPFVSFLLSSCATPFGPWENPAPVSRTMYSECLDRWASLCVSRTCCVWGHNQILDSKWQEVCHIWWYTSMMNIPVSTDK